MELINEMTAWTKEEEEVYDKALDASVRMNQEFKFHILMDSDGKRWYLHGWPEEEELSDNLEDILKSIRISFEGE